MNASDKRKLKKVLQGRDVVYGDDASTTPSDSSLYANLLAQTGLNVMQTVQQKQAADEARKKAEAAKAAAVNPERDAAVADLKQKTKAASNAAAEAHVAQLKAQTETDPNGPLHVAAKNAMTKAALYAADAQGAADKVAAFGVTPSDMKALVKNDKGFKLPSWVLPVGIGVGVLGVGLIAYKLIRRKK